MSAFTLSTAERALLVALCGKRVQQLVFDYNAVYFVYEGQCLKLEAEMAAPPSPEPNELADAAVLRVHELQDPPTFADAGEEGYWYEVVGNDVDILAVELVQTAVLMPQERIAHPSTRIPEGSMATLCDCGLLVTTDQGVLPAVQLYNGYGFGAWPDKRLYQRAEVVQALSSDYSIVALCIAGAT